MHIGQRYIATSLLISALALSGCNTLPKATYRPIVTAAAPTATVNSSAQLSTKPAPEVKAPTPALSTSGNSKLKGSMVVATARRFLGCKYKAGAAGPKRFDCSGFTYYVYSQYGIKLNRSSRDQWLNGVEVKNTRLLQPGDLVFWTGSNAKGSIGHVGIVVEANSITGTFSFIHAAMSGIQIDQSSADYYAKRYKGARRVIY